MWTSIVTGPKCRTPIAVWDHQWLVVPQRDEEFAKFQEEIARRHWAPLVSPMAKLDLEIVMEFYANVKPQALMRRLLASFCACRGRTLPGLPRGEGYGLCVPAWPLSRKSGWHCCLATFSLATITRTSLAKVSAGLRHTDIGECTCGSTDLWCYLPVCRDCAYETPGGPRDVQ